MLRRPPGEADGYVYRKRRCVEEIRIGKRRCRPGGRRKRRGPATHPTRQIEDRVLAFTRIENPISEADGPFIVGAVGDPNPRREIAVIGVDQPAAHAAIADRLEGRRAWNSTIGGPEGNITEVETVVEAPGRAGADINGMKSEIRHIRLVGERLLELNVRLEPIRIQQW